MNVEVEKLFSEIGKLHINVALLQEQLAAAQKKIQEFQQAKTE